MNASMASANALLEGWQAQHVARPCVMVVFGASGDLSSRKLMPALQRLALRRELPGGFAVVGVARTPFNDEDFRRFARDAVSKYGAERPAGSDEVWRSVTESFYYIAGDYRDDDTFRRLSAVLDDIDRRNGTGGNRLHYLAVPPATFPIIVRALGCHRLNRPARAGTDVFVRIIIEKPYGRDLRTANELDACVHQVFEEAHVYRIDHYLGKETVQNLLALRFANAIFEPIWNGHYVDAIQITVAESEGVAGRAGFYEQTGALRDIVQNHVMQVVALTLMEPPITMNADGIRDEKVKVFRSIESLPVDEVQSHVVAAQYAEGWVAGHRVPGYLDEPGVSPTSTTETYVALRLRADNWRWAGVPLYIRTGKRMPTRMSEIVVQFHAAPHLPFWPDQTRGLRPNALVLRIQPDEGITLLFGGKVPGHGFDVRTVAMDFRYGSAFPGGGPEAYERLLLDAMLGDPTLFIRADEVMETWRIVEPILRCWEEGRKPLARYLAGTWGPEAADQLIELDGRRWWTR